MKYLFVFLLIGLVSCGDANTESTTRKDKPNDVTNGGSLKTDSTIRFLNYEINNTQDLLNHLKIFKSTWIKILKSPENYDNFVTKMRYLDEADDGVIADLKRVYQQEPAILITLSRGLPKEAKDIYVHFFFQRVFDDNDESSKYEFKIQDFLQKHE